MLVTIDVAVSFIQDPSLAIEVPFRDDVMTPGLPADKKNTVKSQGYVSIESSINTNWMECDDNKIFVWIWRYAPQLDSTSDDIRSVSETNRIALNCH